MLGMPVLTRAILFTTAAALLAGVGVGQKAHAAAFYLQDQSVRGLGRAYSGEVADTGTASLWYNPASIAGSPSEVYLGANAILTDSKVQDQGSTLTTPLGTGPVGGDPKAINPVQFGVVPNGGVSYRLNDRFAVGLSTAAPFNFTTQYPADSFVRYEALKSRLTSIDLQLTGAAKITSWLDVGVGFDTQYTSANLAQSYPGILPGIPDGNLDLKGDAYNFGYVLGAQAHFQRFQFGISYRSAVDHDLDGRVEFGKLTGLLSVANQSSKGTADFTTPWILSLGGRYHLTDRFTLNAQVQRFGWSEFDTVKVDAGTLTSTIPLYYKDTTSGSVGIDYVLTPAVTLRAGVGYDQTPTTVQFRSPQVPDSDRMLYTLGASVKATPRLTIDAGAGYVAFLGSNIDLFAGFYGGTIAQSYVHQQASVSGDAKILSLGMRYAY